jgi:Cu(I)/Ag(I) efflux system membrane fusion protein
MIRMVAACLMLLLGLALGYWAGRLQLPATAQAPGEKKPLYYRHPMNAQVTSKTPAKDEMGMDYVPVYAEQSAPSTAAPQSAKILYYRHPMGAADTSPTPKKDEMGMDYLPVYEQESAPAGQVQLSPEKVQKLGVNSETIAKRSLTRTISALGTIQADERRIQAVTAKFEGWIEHLTVNATGQTVKRGQLLFEAYSPELIVAEQEYFIARQGLKDLQQGSAQARDTARQLADNALRRLAYWDIAPAQLQRLQKQDRPLPTLALLSPVAGVVVDKPAQQGMRFMPGELLFRIADLSRVWLVAELSEQDIAAVHVDQAVQVTVNAYPGRIFGGKVDFIYPLLTTETRTVKARIELANSEGLLKPGLYGSVTLATLEKEDLRLAVPDSAVIDSGVRQVVLVDKGQGRFQPRAVKLGMHGDGYREVLDGLEPGDWVVTRANFLIDAESNLKSALDGFGAAGGASGGDSEQIGQGGH